MEKMEMRPSRALSKLRSGEVASCFKLNLADARAVEIAALAGFDCVWVDREHVSNDLSVIEKCVWAGKAHDTDVIVRVPRGSYSDYVHPLELDAAGIMVPHVMSLADAKEVVRMTRFHPVGRRPMDGGNADGAYCSIEFGDYIQQANERRMVILQIEDPEVLTDLDKIAALDGIDMLFFGPGDFSQGIGCPGEWNHPDVIETRRRVAEVALSHGKIAGTISGLDNMDELIELGYRFLCVGADVLGLSQYCRSIVDEFAKREN